MSKSTKRVTARRSKSNFTMGSVRPAASGGEAFLSLTAKLNEEVAEVIRDPLDVSEYGDALQVLMDLAELNGIEWPQVLESQADKLDQKGGYLPVRIWVNDELGAPKI